VEEVADAEDATAAREVGLQTGIAVAGGERLATLGEFRRHFEAKAFSPAHGVYVQPPNRGGPLATAACVNLPFSLPNALIQEIFPSWPEDDRLDMVDAPYERQVVDGHLAVPTRPGLGVELNEDYLARFEQIEA
jgi:galactonate dehydratase